MGALESASTAAGVVSSGPAGPRPTAMTAGRRFESALIEGADRGGCRAEQTARQLEAFGPVPAPGLGTMRAGGPVLG